MKPHHVGRLKTWHSINTSNLEGHGGQPHGTNHTANDIYEDLFIRKFIIGVFHHQTVPEQGIAILRRYLKVLRLANVMSHVYGPGHKRGQKKKSKIFHWKTVFRLNEIEVIVTTTMKYNPFKRPEADPPGTIRDKFPKKQFDFDQVEDFYFKVGFAETILTQQLCRHVKVTLKFANRNELAYNYI